MIARKAVLQDVRVSGAHPALKDRCLRSQAATMKGDGNEPIFSCSLPKMVTHRPLLTTRSSMTIPFGSSISTAGKSKARALRKVANLAYLMTRATDSLLPTSMSTPAPLLRQASGTWDDCRSRYPSASDRAQFSSNDWAVFKNDVYLTRPGHPQPTT